jgi:hypothetical protein
VYFTTFKVRDLQSETPQQFCVSTRVTPRDFLPRWYMNAQFTCYRSTQSAARSEAKSLCVVSRSELLPVTVSLLKVPQFVQKSVSELLQICLYSNKKRISLWSRYYYVMNRMLSLLIYIKRRPKFVTRHRLIMKSEGYKIFCLIPREEEYWGPKFLKKT